VVNSQDFRERNMEMSVGDVVMISYKINLTGKRQGNKEMGEGNSRELENKVIIERVRTDLEWRDVMARYLRERPHNALALNSMIFFFFLGRGNDKKRREGKGREGGGRGEGGREGGRREGGR
jgi:hypothetical protein